jgi:hypothetical protein
MKNLLLAISIAALVFSCANPASSGSSDTTKTITSFAQLPAATWTADQSQTSGGYTITVTDTLVTDGSTTAKTTVTMEWTSFIAGMAKASGQSEATLWAAMQSSLTGYTFTSSSPWIATQTSTTTDAQSFTSGTVVTLTNGKTLTVKVTSTSSGTTSTTTLVFTKQ